MLVLRTPQEYPDQEQTVSLGGVSYRLRLTWRPYCAAWYMDLSTMAGESILLGVRVEPGANLLLWADPTVAPPGGLMAVASGVTGDEGERARVAVALTRPVVVSAGVNDALEFDETLGGGGGPFVATIAPGTYYWLGDGSPADYCKAIADAMTAVGAWVYSCSISFSVLEFQTGGGQRYEINTTAAATTISPWVLGVDPGAPPGSEPSDGSGQAILTYAVSRWPLNAGHIYADPSGVEWRCTANISGLAGAEPATPRQAVFETVSPAASTLAAGSVLTSVAPADAPVGVVQTIALPYEAGADAIVLQREDLGQSLILVYVTQAEVDDLAGA